MAGPATLDAADVNKQTGSGQKQTSGGSGNGGGGRLRTIIPNQANKAGVLIVYGIGVRGQAENTKEALEMYRNSKIDVRLAVDPNIYDKVFLRFGSKAEEVKFHPDEAKKLITFDLSQNRQIAGSIADRDIVWVELFSKKQPALSGLISYYFTFYSQTSEEAKEQEEKAEEAKKNAEGVKESHISSGPTGLMMDAAGEVMAGVALPFAPAFVTRNANKQKLLDELKKGDQGDKSAIQKTIAEAKKLGDRDGLREALKLAKDPRDIASINAAINGIDKAKKPSVEPTPPTEPAESYDEADLGEGGEDQTAEENLQEEALAEEGADFQQASEEVSYFVSGNTGTITDDAARERVKTALQTGTVEAVRSLSQNDQAALRGVLNTTITSQGAPISQGLQSSMQAVNEQVFGGSAQTRAEQTVSAAQTTQAKVQAQAGGGQETTIEQTKQTQVAASGGAGGGRGQVQKKISLDVSASAGLTSAASTGAPAGEKSLSQNLNVIGSFLKPEEKRYLIAGGQVGAEAQAEVLEALISGKDDDLSQAGEVSLAETLQALSESKEGVRPDVVKAAQAAIKQRAARAASAQIQGALLATAVAKNQVSESPGTAGQSGAGKQPGARQGGTGTGAGTSASTGPKAGAEVKDETGTGAEGKTEQAALQPQQGQTVEEIKPPEVVAPALGQFKANEEALERLGIGKSPKPGGGQAGPKALKMPAGVEGSSIAPRPSGGGGLSGAASGLGLSGGTEALAGEERQDQNISGQTSQLQTETTDQTGQPSPQGPQQPPGTPPTPDSGGGGAGLSAAPGEADEKTPEETSPPAENTGVQVPAPAPAKKGLSESQLTEASQIANKAVNSFLNTQILAWVWVPSLPSFGLSILIGAIVLDGLWLMKDAIVSKVVKNNPLLSAFEGLDVKDLKIKFSWSIKLQIIAMNLLVIAIPAFIFLLIMIAGCNFPAAPPFSVMNLAGYGEYCSSFDVEKMGANLGTKASTYIATGGKCSSLASGDASPANLASTCFGSNAATASVVANRESGGDPTQPSGVDICLDSSGNKVMLNGKPVVVSWGLFQINLTVHKIAGLNCPRAFDKAYTGSSKQCQVIDPDLYNSCVQAAQNSQFNIQTACQLSNNGANWGAWANTAAACNINT